jgi:TP901 family phage tail tape measure protein
MATRDEKIRFIAEVEGKKDVEGMGQAFDAVGKAADKADPAAKALIDDLERLGKDKSAIQAFVKLKAELAETSPKLATAKAELERLRVEMGKTDTVSKGLQKSFDAAEKEVARLTKAENKQTVELVKLGGQLAKAGVDTNNLTAADKRLNDEAAKLAQRTRDLADKLTAEGKAARDAAGGVGELAKKSKEAKYDSDGLFGVLGKIGPLAAALGVAFAGIKIGGDAFGGAVAIEQSLSRVKAIAEGTAEQFAQLGSKVQEAARDVQVAPEVAAQALAELAGQGQTVEQAFASLVPTLRLAKIAAIDVGAAAGAVDDVLDLFGLSADKAGHAVDVLVKASKGSDEGLNGLTGALSKIAPTARDAGLSLEDTVGILGIFVQNGISAEKAAKVLVKVFGDLRDPTSELRQNLSDLGDNSGDLATAIETLAGAGDKSRKTLDGLDSSARHLVLFLIQQGKGAIGEFTKSLQDVDGVAEKVAKTLDDNLGGAFKNAKASFSNLATAFLTPILAPLKDEIVLVGKAFDDFAKTEAFKRLSEALVVFVETGLSALNKFVAELDFEKVATNLENFGTNASAFFTKFRSDIEGVATFTGKLLTGIGVAFDGTATVIHGAATAIAGALAGIVKAAALVASLNIGQELNDKLAGVQSTAEKLDELASALFESAKANYDSTGTAAEGFKAKLDALTNSLNTGKPAVEGTAAALTTMGTAAEGLPEKAGAAVAAIDEIGLAGIRAATGAVGAATAIDGFGEAIQKANTPLEAAKLRLSEAKDALVALQQSAEATPEALAKANAEFQAATLALQKLTVATKDDKKAADELAQAYKDLSQVSQADLVTAYDKTVKALDTVIRAQQRGAATSEDVRRAFIAMAEAQLRVVADSDSTTRARAENELRVKAATLGVVDALDKLGLAGKKAGDDVAAGASKATGALEETAATADKAAASAENLGASSNTAAAGLQNVTTAGQAAAETALDVSQAFTDSATSILGLDRVAFNVLSEQQRQAAEMLETLRSQNLQYDEQAQRLAQLRQQFSALGDAQLEQIAREQQLLEQNRQRAQQERAREQQSNTTTMNSGGGSGAAIPRGSLVVELKASRVDADALMADSGAMDKLTRAFAKRLQDLAGRGGFSLK